MSVLVRRAFETFTTAQTLTAKLPRRDNLEEGCFFGRVDYILDQVGQKVKPFAGALIAQRVPPRRELLDGGRAVA